MNTSVRRVLCIRPNREDIPLYTKHQHHPVSVEKRCLLRGWNVGRYDDQ